MSYLVSYSQSSIERKRYTVSYDRWMDADEALFDTVFLIDPVTVDPLIVEGAYTTAVNRELSFFLRGGLPGTLYIIKIVAKTTDNQIKEDDIQVEIS